MTSGTSDEDFVSFTFFCLGGGLSSCSDATSFYDALSNQCYTSAACPVTPFGDYLTNNLCPNC